MANIKFIISALALASSGVYAGYAQVSPPPSWANNAIRVAANDASFSNGVRSATSAVLNVGGRSVSMPVAYRFAANAGQIAARSAFGNPALFVGVAAAALAYQYFTDNDFVVDDLIWKKKEIISRPCVGSECWVYKYDFVGTGTQVIYNSHTAACEGLRVARSVGATGTITSSITVINAEAGLYQCWVASSTMGSLGMSYLSPTTVVKEYQVPVLKPVTEDQFATGMDAKAVPVGVPQEWPVADMWWPVLQPIMNPSPEPVPKPQIAPVPVQQPLRVPQGDPVPVPQTDPQQWRTPAIDIVPSPTAVEPWRVDIQPKDILKTDSEPLPETAPVPVTPPAGQTEAEKQQDLCEKNPEILACQKLDEVDDVQLGTEDKTVSISPDGGWGGGNGSCPAPRRLTGANVEFTFQPICDFMSGLRPIVIAVAWLSAAFILLGFKQGE